MSDIRPNKEAAEHLPGEGLGFIGGICVVVHIGNVERGLIFHTRHAELVFPLFDLLVYLTGGIYRGVVDGREEIVQFAFQNLPGRHRGRPAHLRRIE